MLGVGSSSKIERTIRMGSKVTRSAMEKAETVSMGMNRKISKFAEYHVQKSTPHGIINRGSRAGLRDEKSVHLATNGSGYMNPAHHQARYKSKRQVALSLNTTGSMVYNSSSRMTSSDFRLSRSNCSSISRLSKMVK